MIAIRNVIEEAVILFLRLVIPDELEVLYAAKYMKRVFLAKCLLNGTHHLVVNDPLHKVVAIA